MSASSCSLFAWFDWEDGTTTVQKLSKISHPRKEWSAYVVGESVTADFSVPGKGMVPFQGVILEIAGK
jgi:hypothetical protein